MVKLHIHRERSIESLLKEHKGIILKVCAMYVPHRHPHSEEWREDVRDLFQEIALKLVESWPKYRGKCSESTWVYRIATNVAISNLRRFAKRRIVLVDETTLDLLEAEADDEIVERLYRRIDKLSDDERQLITYAIGKVPLKEVADIMGLTEDAVKHRMKRTKEKLKQMNDDYE
ncbi:MAG: sigma-70 family RNA polymerase sigma factor [Bacteroidales bacterium]|nr:sigma-70 family RNA polymerase sigma factor [Bacteroidales bacterium]